MSRRTWIAALGSFAALRAAVPLVALAAGSVPGVMPPYEYAPLNGDSHGFYAAAREVLAAPPSLGVPRLALLTALVAAGTAAAVLLGRRRRWYGIAAAAWAAGLALAVVVDEVPPPGAAVIGWPILWAIPLAPLRVAGGLDPDTAFAVALPLQLLANAVAVVACGYAGWYATGRRWAGIGAAALFTAWPLVTRALAGPDAWANGQWHVDVGLHLYTEPISTALVVVALALLLSPRLDAVRLTLAGVLLGFGTAVRVSNGLLAAAVVVLVVGRLGVRRAAPLLVGGAAFVPLVLVYWPKGYPEIPNVPTFSPGHAARNWSESLVFTPWVTVALVVLAVAGAFAVRDRWHALLLGAAVAVNPAFYTFYEVTYLHPRFLYASLPPLFVLVAAAVVGVRPRKSEASVDV